MTDVKSENEMLFKSEERVQRLLEEINDLKALGRQKDRDTILL